MRHTISLREFRLFLASQSLEKVRTKGGHEIWQKAGLTRPVVLQTHIDPVPIHVVKSNLRTLGVSVDALEEFLKNN